MSLTNTQPRHGCGVTCTNITPQSMESTLLRSPSLSSIRPASPSRAYRPCPRGAPERLTPSGTDGRKRIGGSLAGAPATRSKQRRRARAMRRNRLRLHQSDDEGQRMLSPLKPRKRYLKMWRSSSMRTEKSRTRRKPKSHLARLARELLADKMQAARMVYAIPGRRGEHPSGGD